MTPMHDDRKSASDSGWHLKREIQLGHVFTTLTVAFSCFVYVSKIETRLTIIEQQTAASQSVQRERDDRQDKNNAELMGMLRTQLERMEAKLDRIVEKKT